MTLDIFCAKQDGVTVIKAAGEMDYHNFRVLKTSVEQSLADGERKFIFNLADLAYLDSSALGSLLYNQKRVRDANGDMVVIAGRALTEILNLTHLDSYFNIVESVEAGQSWLAEIDLPSRSNVSKIQTRG
ncbi:MAG: STAS domain-containing protein [Actinomycetota bacterium]|nr:STAS domain-containing protein [Actinomycetota bacterium]